MNRNIKFLLALAVLSCAGQLGFAEPASPTEALLKDAQAKARTNEIAVVREAYDKVFAAPDVTVAQRVTAHLDIARVLAAKKQSGEAVKECEKALAIPDLPAAERFKVLNASASAQFSANFEGALSSYAEDGISAAAAIYEKIAVDPAASNSVRIAALKSLADCQLEKMDVTGANATLERAVALPGLQPDEKNAARFNLAKAWQRELEYAEARKAYEELLGAEPSKALRAELEKGIAATQAAEKKVEVPQAYGEDDSELKALRQAVADPQLADKARLTALEKILPILVSRREFAEARSLYETQWPGLLAQSGKRANPLLRLLGRPHANTAAIGYSEFAAWVAKTVLAIPDLPEKDAMTYRTYLLDELSGGAAAVRAHPGRAQGARGGARVRQGGGGGAGGSQGG